MSRHCFAFLALTALFSGCASLEDYHYRKVNEWRATSAYFSAKSSLPKECTDKDFGKGWRDGYFAVSTGECATQPAVPPPCYWDPSYQNAEGRCQIERYYAGWQSGALAAEKCSRNTWHYIPARQSANCCKDEQPTCFIADQTIDATAAPACETVNR